MGAIIAGSTHISDDDFIVASKVLASTVSAADLEAGSVYPGLDKIREVSAAIAAGVAENMFATGRSTKPRPSGSMIDACKASMYVPEY